MTDRAQIAAYPLRAGATHRNGRRSEYAAARFPVMRGAGGGHACRGMARRRVGFSRSPGGSLPSGRPGGRTRWVRPIVKLRETRHRPRRCKALTVSLSLNPSYGRQARKRFRSLVAWQSEACPPPLPSPGKHRGSGGHGVQERAFAYLRIFSIAQHVTGSTLLITPSAAPVVASPPRRAAVAAASPLPTAPPGCC